MNEFNQEGTFMNLNINELVYVINEVIINKMTNFIPHLIFICSDKDHSSINSLMKKLIHKESSLWKDYPKNNDFSI